MLLTALQRTLQTLAGIVTGIPGAGVFIPLGFATLAAISLVRWLQARATYRHLAGEFARNGTFDLEDLPDVTSSSRTLVEITTAVCECSRRLPQIPARLGVGLLVAALELQLGNSSQWSGNLMRFQSYSAPVNILLLLAAICFFGWMATAYSARSVTYAVQKKMQDA